MLVALALATALHAAQTTSSIGGQVLNSVDDEPVNGVELVLTEAASASTPLKFVTETRGLFLFENLPPGRYVLLAEKGGFARQANAILQRTGRPFWQEESYDRWGRGPKEMGKLVQYIEQNPVTAGLVERAEDWRWSSAFGG